MIDAERTIGTLIDKVDVAFIGSVDGGRISKYESHVTAAEKRGN